VCHSKRSGHERKLRRVSIVEDQQYHQQKDGACVWFVGRAEIIVVELMGRNNRVAEKTVFFS
jgi:hypothetical protein